MNVCGAHPRKVYYDGAKCPCCQMLREINYITRKKVFEGTAKKGEFLWKRSS
jgi:Zn ribbon nucleic-acid-binding protein